MFRGQSRNPGNNIPQGMHYGSRHPPLKDPRCESSRVRGTRTRPLLTNIVPLHLQTFQPLENSRTWASTNTNKGVTLHPRDARLAQGARECVGFGQYVQGNVEGEGKM
eukprot:gene19228-6506_t